MILDQLKKLRWREMAVVVAFILSVSVAAFFVVRVVRPIVYWHNHQDEPIQGWMTVGYVAHSYHVPPHILYQALGLPHKPPDKRPLREIAKTQKRSMDEIKAVLMTAIVHARPPYPPPPPPSPGPGNAP